MFETVVPEVVQAKSRRVLYETLPVSIALHVIVIAAAITGAVWTVVFPTESPRLVRSYSLVTVPEPPPPPTPPPPPQVKPVAAPVKAAPPPALKMVHMDLAPIVIPDLVPVVEPPPPVPPPPEIVTPATPVTMAASTAGTNDGIAGGQIGGVKHGTVGGIVFAEDGRVHIDRTEKLPLKEVEKVYPHYPEGARSKRLEDTVVVRYTIGKNGRVIDVAILEHAKAAMFDDETLNTVRQWKFRPMMINGKPVEVVHEVEVYYQFIAR
jgi:protein TonB